MKYKINDILYTKDGRKSGNLIVVDAYTKTISIAGYTLTADIEHYICMSDYGNMITIVPELNLHFKSQFFLTPGKATNTHKYYNYKQHNPELFL